MEQQKHGYVSCDALPPLCSKYPWLVSQSPEAEEQIFYTIHDPSFHHRCRIPQLLGKRIRGFFHGWAILSNHPHNDIWSLWNPSTSNVIRLPPLKKRVSNHVFTHSCLSAPPDDPSSVLLLTRANSPTFVFCRLGCKRNRLRWFEMSYARQLNKITGDGGLLHSLTWCNGKVYALCTGGTVAEFVIYLDIVVIKDKVVIKVLLFGGCPVPHNIYMEGEFEEHFMMGSSTELFCVIVGFDDETKKTVREVSLFKLDTTGVRWDEIEGLNKDWDMSNLKEEDLQEEDVAGLDITEMMWEEMSDLKDAVFFVDLAQDYAVAYYCPAVASELGGYIYIRDQTGRIVHAYKLEDRTDTLSGSVLPTSYVSLWECRLEGDFGDYKQGGDNVKGIRSVTDAEVEFKDSRLLDLPFDVMEMIMKFCVGVEYMNFRATCKQCHQAAPLISWRDRDSSRRLQNYSLVTPWLMMVDEIRGVITFTDPLFGDKYFMKNLQVSIYEKQIYCSRFGWLLFVTDNGELVFYNPFTNDIRELPEMDCISNSSSSFCFSAPPTSPDCKVVGIIKEYAWYVHIHFVAGEPSWRKLHLDFGDAMPDSLRFPTFYGGDLYVMCNEGKLHFKDLGVGDYSLEQDVAKAPASCCRSPAQRFLMKCDQHLLLAMISAESIEVFKLDDDTKEWGRIDHLGRHMIFICGKTCLCVEAKTSEMENKIYFAEMHSKNRRLVFYSLETCTYGTFDSQNIEVTLERTYQLYYSQAWIEPSWT